MQIKTTQALPSADLAGKVNRFVLLCGLIKLCTCTAVNYYPRNDLTTDHTDGVETVKMRTSAHSYTLSNRHQALIVL